MFASLVFAQDSVVTKAALQGTVQRHIDRNAIDGAFPFFNFATREVEDLFPTEAHPLILVVDGIFVLCADLRTINGERRIVDFYLVKTEKGYKVIRTEIENRKPLEKLIKAGVTKRLK